MTFYIEESYKRFMVDDFFTVEKSSLMTSLYRKVVVDDFLYRKDVENSFYIDFL